MVMEASPSPQSVGREFVRQYYTLLNKAPAHLHRFYNNYSSFVHGGLDAHAPAHAHAHAPARETLPVVGQKQIHNRIQQLNFRDCHAKISQVDSQATLGNGVVVQVTGELSNGGAPMRRFTQTFVLAAQSPKKYYVHNDIFRYQDIVFSDEEGSGSGRSEGEEDEGSVGGAGSAGYFPPPPAAFPAPFPAPPRLQPEPAQPAQVQQEPPAQSAQSAQLQPEPPQPQPAHHLNGHPPPPPPQQHEDATRHLVSAMQATSVSSAERIERVPSGAERAERVERVERVEANPSPPPREPTPPPAQPPSPPPQPPAAPEPKTYANLLKSGAPAHQAARVSPPHQPHAAQQGAPAHAPAHAPAPAPQYAGDARVRARLPRDAPPLDGSGNASGGALGGGVGGVGGGMGGSRRYSDAQQLFLGNLPHAATEEELRVLFARFGPVHELRVHCKPPQPGSAAPKHPNYGFITYESAHAAAACLAAQPLYYPAEGAEGCVKLNVEEKKARAGSAAPPAPRHPRRPPSQPRRDAANTRPPYRR